MRVPRPFSRYVSLRRAATTLFALVAVLPLLLLYYLHEHFATMTIRRFQVSLLLVGGLALVGFYTFHRLVGRISETARSLGGLNPGGTASDNVPGLGRIAEIGEMRAAFGGMLDTLRSSTVRLEDLVVKASTLHEIAEVAARVSDIQELLPIVLDRTMRTVNATAGAVMLYERDRQALRLVAERGRPQGSPDGPEVKLGEGIAGRVAQTGEALVIEDTATDPRFAAGTDPARSGGSFLCWPVRVDDRVVGVINLAKRMPGAGGGAPGWSPADLQFLGTIMTHVAYALDNARLLLESRLATEQLQDVVNELRATQARLVEGERLRAMGQLASGMAHHLNNLMMVVSGRVQTVLAGVEDERTKRSLGLVHRAAMDAAEVVGRVRRFASTEPVTRAVAVDLNQVAREVVELTRARWRDEAEVRGITIDTVMDLARVPSIEGEPAPLREALMNLVLNAVDAMPAGGTLTIRTWVSDGAVCCSIGDTGVGMSDEVKRRALEPFFTTKGPRGMGLGMSLIHGIVQGHCGDLEIESAPGKGTVVTIRVPQRSATAGPGAGDEVSAPGAALRVLLVDDDPGPRGALAELLATDGHEVVAVDSGRAALARLAQDAHVDLVLTDLGMPEMNGWDVAREVKARHPDLPVGLITGWGKSAVGTPEERRRIDFLVPKPCTTDALRAAFASVRFTPVAV
jgi:signal transduction histidine kinase